MAKNCTEMWTSLGMNTKAHEALLGVLGKAYSEVFLTQQNRPAGMGYLDFVMSEIHGLRIETDYSMEDAAQLKTRIQAFIELLK